MKYFVISLRETNYGATEIDSKENFDRLAEIFNDDLNRTFSTVGENQLIILTDPPKKL